MVDATQCGPWTSALSWVRPCSSASDLAASATSAGRVAGRRARIVRGRRGGGGGPTPADNMMKATNPDLFAVAAKYFPGTDAAMARRNACCASRAPSSTSRRRRCCPRTGETAAVAAVPPDPLQTNYEYAANLSFNAGELHALHEVGRRHHRQRSRQPGQRRRLRGQQQFAPPACRPRRRSSWRARSAARRRTRSSRATPTCSRPAWPRWACPTRRGSGRRHADVAELRLPRRGADRRRPGCCCRRSGCRHRPTRWPTRRPRRSACRRRRRRSCRAPTTSQTRSTRCSRRPRRAPS